MATTGITSYTLRVIGPVPLTGVSWTKISGNNVTRTFTTPGCYFSSSDLAYIGRIAFGFIAGATAQYTLEFADAAGGQHSLNCNFAPV